MYPKVKVREQEQEDQLDYEISSLQPFESLSLHDFSSPVEECKDDSPTYVVRIHSSSAMPMVSTFKGTAKNINKKSEENKLNIKASSVPQPRAVLSSPVNDGILGSKKNTRTELLSGLKHHNLCQNRHIQCKVIPRPVVAESPINTRGESKEAAHKKNDLQGEKRSVIANPTQRAYLRSGKPQCVRN